MITHRFTATPKGTVTVSSEARNEGTLVVCAVGVK
jgi:hypothetical protein